MQESTGIVIVGAGPGGLCMAIKLLEAGFDDFVVLERADGVGGTWRHNTLKPSSRGCLPSSTSRPRPSATPPP